jgi:hypothetical protein
LVVVENLDVRRGKQRGRLARIERKIARSQFEEVTVGTPAAQRKRRVGACRQRDLRAGGSRSTRWAITS